MFAAINAMLLDMLAAVARKDYEDRRRRQAQGIAKAKLDGAYRGRPEDTARLEGIGFDASIRHVMDRHSSGDRMLAGHDCQGGEAGRLGGATRLRERRSVVSRRLGGP